MLDFNSIWEECGRDKSVFTQHLKGFGIPDSDIKRFLNDAKSQQ